MTNMDFWSHDYLSGVNNLALALKQSQLENEKLIELIKKRIKLESQHASNLSTIHKYTPPQTNLELSLNKISEMQLNESFKHVKIQTELETQVVQPLMKWFKMYKQRVTECIDSLNKLSQDYQKLLNQLSTKRQFYFEQCRKLENSKIGNSPKDPFIKTFRLFKENLLDFNQPIFNANQQEFNLAGLKYRRHELGQLIQLLLSQMTLMEYKVPFLMSYENVCTGAMLASAARKQLQNDSFAYSEKFGQSLCDLGLLKPVGQISNTFQSTHASHYQWQKSAFDLAENLESENESIRSSHSTASTTSELNGDLSEENYLQAVLELDDFRCNMEVEFTKTFAFLGQLELDRITAFRHGMTDFQLVMQLPTLELNLMETYNSWIKRYRTGPYIPTVTVFENYFASNVVQTFGVQTSTFWLPLVCHWLERQPNLNLNFWINREPLDEVFKLRREINTGKPFNVDTTFKFFTLPVVVSTVCQYLLELPESLVSFVVYERFKQMYLEETNSVDEIVDALLQVPKRNCESLEVFISFLARLYTTTDEYRKLSKALGFFILRPRAPNSFNMDDTHGEQLMLDLLTNSEKIFTLLKSKQTAGKHARTPTKNRSPIHTPEPRSPLRQVSYQSVPLSLNKNKVYGTSPPAKAHGFQPFLPVGKDLNPPRMRPKSADERRANDEQRATSERSE